MKRLGLSLVLLLGTLGFATVAVAKPLYITVPRSFGSSEAVAVDIAFQHHEPVELRVLRPTDIAKFVQSQANLRRAYDRPSLEINTGRYLTRGLNELRSPGNTLLDAIDPELRRAVSVEMPERTKTAHASGVRLATGPKHLIDIPQNTKLVDRRWLNLDLGSTEREFNVPGFTGWSASSSGFQERTVSLGKMAPGVYVLQVVQGRVEGQVLLVVTDLSVQVKQTDGEVLVRVAGRDQRPREGANIRIFSAAGAGPTGTTNQRGEVTLKSDEPKLVALAQVGADVAVVDTDFYSTLAIAPDVFIYTDRPIYKPGNTASFRGVVRQPDSFLSRLFRPDDQRVKVTVLSQDGDSVSTTAKVDSFGTFHGTVKAPGKNTGILTFVATLDDRPYQAEARVQDYVKPSFYLEIRADQETIRPGETLSANIRGRLYSGGPTADTKFEVTLSRSVLDTPAWVDDAGLGAEGSAVTYGSESTTEGTLSIPTQLFNSAAQRGGDWSNALTLDQNGEATIAIPVPALDSADAAQPFRYVLTVQALDEDGGKVTKSKPFFYAPTEVLGTLKSSSKVVLQGGEARVAIRATTPSGKVFGVTKGSVEFVLETADGTTSSVKKVDIETDFDGVWRGVYPASDVGRLYAKASLNDGRGAVWTGETSILVAGRSGEPIVRVPLLTTESIGGQLEVGDTAQVVALFPENWGPQGKNHGYAWLTLQGSKIFSTKMVEFDGRTLVYEFPIEKQFGSAVYASIAHPSASGRWEERIVPFRVVPKERALRISIEALQREAEPLSEQTIELVVTDHEGRGVQAQLSVGVVDKAIYALQREFRPHVLEFFYPLVRNNVTSFFSIDFQGYGYGELLALKRAGIGLHAFASIKPPTLEEKEDTAYWNPQVVTGTDGRAIVKFRLPGNQTLWTITAVAADDAGRFGEATSEFATRGQLSVVTSVPQFLRVGDRATGSVRLAKGDKGKAITELDVSWQTSGAAAAKSASPVVKFGSSTEQFTPIVVEAEKLGRALVAVQVKGQEIDVVDSRPIPITPNTIEETRAVESFGGGDLTLDVPEGAKVTAVEVEIMPTSVAVALANLRSLLSYPYGCLEQRVATTIPNIAVFQTLEKAGAVAALDESSKTLLSEARSRAVRGVAQIMDLALPTGGFTWFNGYETPSVELTLIALDGLAYAKEAGLASATDPEISRSLRWLEQQAPTSPELFAMRTYVLTRWGGKKFAPLARAQLEQGVTGNVHADALAVLSAKAAGVLDEEANKPVIAALAAASYEALAARDRFDFNSRAFWRFPMRTVGLGAVLAHAATYGEVDAETLRGRMTTLMSESMNASTLDRSTFLLHSQWLLLHDAKKLSKLVRPTVTAEGTVGEAKPRGLGLVFSLDPSARKATVSSFDGVARLTATMASPAGAAQAKRAGMAITRAYFRVAADGTKTAIAAKEPVHVGEDIYVELQLDADGQNRGLRSAYYVVTDDVPAGFVTVQEDKAFRGAPYGLPLDHEALRRRTFSPQRVTMFFDEPTWWSGSPRVIGYVMRARYAGSFVAPPARIEDMYASSIAGSSNGFRFEIAPQK